MRATSGASFESPSNDIRGGDTRSGMEFPLRSAQIRSAFDQGKPLLAGKTGVACMGDLKTLASFSLDPVVSETLIGAYTTQDEAADACQQKTPDLFFVTENLEQVALMYSKELLHPFQKQVNTGFSGIAFDSQSPLAEVRDVLIHTCCLERGISIHLKR